MIDAKLLIYIGLKSGPRSCLIIVILTRNLYLTCLFESNLWDLAGW